jgi:DNA-binding NarL/FixJ family response regulator
LERQFYKIFNGTEATSCQEKEDDNDELLRILYAYKLDMRVLEKSLEVMDEEVEEYKSHERETDDKITFASADIIALSTELEQQKKIRQCREEIERLARVVNVLPTRSSMKKRSVEIDSDFKKTQDLIKLFETRIKERSLQFGGVMDLLEAVQTSLAEDRKIDPSLADAEGSDDEDAHRGEDSRKKKSRQDDVVEQEEDGEENIDGEGEATKEASDNYGDDAGDLGTNGNISAGNEGSIEIAPARIRLTADP